MHTEDRSQSANPIFASNDVDGAVENPVRFTWDDFLALPQTDDTSDFHCVTTWYKLNMHWKGVRLMDLAALVL
ncbi:molybdopterin-dependent oxidoreductase [Fulvivirgaceae bacterium QH1ED-6-2]|nr:molybdopterin-dependent oxidoreductase [Parachryseolinea silvisoli]